MQSINPIKVITDKNEKEKRGKEGKLTLQKHQEDFIKQFVFSQLRGAVVFHGVGSGKTLTAVVSSYFYLTLYPNNKVIVISPSALLYNFINGMQQYGLNIQDKRYEFLTYEKYIRKPIIAKNALLIIDEAHNFRTEIIQQHITDPETGDILDTTAKQNKRGFTVMKYGALEAHKIIALTGTAFVNTIYDIENLLAFVDKRYPLDKKAFFQSIAIESNLGEYFGNRISYYPTQKSEFFPEKKDFIIPIYMTDEQEAEYNELKLTGNPNKKKSSENPNAYFSAERYATNAIQLENNPKINKIIELLKEKPHQKFIIYTVSIDAGIKLLEKKLNGLDIGYKVISGGQTASQKEESKKYFNGYYTSDYADIGKGPFKISEKEKKMKAWEYELYIDKSEDKELGPYINDKYRVLLITKAGAEGVDTKNCQNLILLDHQWNDATTEQIIARAVRFKSHHALPESERYVNVYTLLFCFQNEEPLINKITQEGFNDWIGAKSEFDAETTNYKQTKKTISKVMNKGLLLQKQFNSNEKLKTSNVRQLFDYFKKVVEKVKEYSIEQIPTLKDKFEEDFNNIIKSEERLISGGDSNGQTIIIHHKGQRAFKNSKKASYETINYYDRIKNKIIEISKSMGNTIDKTEGYGDLESPAKGSIDLYLYILSKTKLKNINEFILNFGGKIELFESYEKKLLPLIEAEEKKYLKKHKRGLTDAEQIKIYKDLLSQEENAIKNLDFSFSIDPKRIIGKTKTTENKLNQFYTSELLAGKIKDLGLKGLKGNLDILEPTAGFGNLIKPLIKELKTEYHIDLIDLDERNRNELKKLVEIAPNILKLLDNKNFLTFSTGKRYDLILMNPPFHLKKGDNSLISDVYDFEFVNRAFAFLKEGGRIVAITGTSWSFNKKWDEFDLFNDAPQDYLNMEMKKNKKVSGESSYLKYSIERLEDEPFLGSEGKKIKMTVDIFVIEKLSSEKDSEILGKSFYLSQQNKGEQLQKVEIDFDVEQKEPEPPLPIPAPIEEIVKEQEKEEVVKEEVKTKPKPVLDIEPENTGFIVDRSNVNNVAKLLRTVVKEKGAKIKIPFSIQSNFKKFDKEIEKILKKINVSVSDFIDRLEKMKKGKKGGNIDKEELSKFVDAGYKTKSEAQNVDGYVLDKELSTKRDKVYYDPNTGKAVHTIAGTDKAKDWTNNLLIPLGLHTYSNRYKNAERIQKEANKKYGKDNLSLVSHSQSGNIAQNLAKKKLVGDENITLNPAIIGSHNKKLKVVKSSGDIVSALTFTNKKDKTIHTNSWNPLYNHSTKILTDKKKKKK